MKPILEHIPLGEEKTIVAFRYSKKDFDMPWHIHPQHELTYIEKSIGTKFIGDYVGDYEPGELVLLRSNVPHFWKNLAQENEIAQSVVIQWNKGIFAHVPELSPIFDLLTVASKSILFEKEETQEIIKTVKEMPLLGNQELYISLLSVLLQLSKCSFTTLSETSFENNLPTEYSNRMKQIHDFVATNFQRKIYLKELAELVNMTEQSFSRFFKKMMGRSFFTFLNEYRVNMASRMLINTDQSVAEIGFACGYDALPFFYKQFKKYKNISPSKYRQQY